MRCNMNNNLIDLIKRKQKADAMPDIRKRYGKLYGKIYGKLVKDDKAYRSYHYYHHDEDDEESQQNQKD